MISHDSPRCVWNNIYDATHSYGMLSAGEHSFGFGKNKRLASSALNSKFKAFQSFIIYTVINIFVDIQKSLIKPLLYERYWDFAGIQRYEQIVVLP